MKTAPKSTIQQHLISAVYSCGAIFPYQARTCRAFFYLCCPKLLYICVGIRIEGRHIIHSRGAQSDTYKLIHLVGPAHKGVQSVSKGQKAFARRARWQPLHRSKDAVYVRLQCAAGTQTSHACRPIVQH